MRLFSPSSVLLLFSITSPLAARTLPVNVDLLWTQESWKACPVDRDCDSVDELMSVWDCSAALFDQRCRVVSETWVFNAPGCHASGGGSGQDLWVEYKRSDSSFVRNLSTRQELFVAHGVDRVPPKGWQGGLRQVEIHDINNDGCLELVATVNTGFELKPRAVIVMDWQTGRQQWRYDLAPQLHRFIVDDLDGDGKEEILVGTIAPGNGNTEDTLTDMHSYVLCLNCDGALGWVRQVGDYGQTADIALLGAPGSERPRLLVCEIGASIPDAEPDSIFILDAIAGTILQKSSFALHNEAFAVAIQPDGSPRIFVASSDSSLRALDAELKVVSQTRLEDGCTWMHAARFTGRRVPEVAVLTLSGSLQLYDSSLALLADRDSILLPPVPMRTEHGVRLLMASSLGELPTWGLHRFSMRPKEPSVVQKVVSALTTKRTISVGLLAVTFLGLATVFIAALSYLRSRRDRDVRAAIGSLSGQAGVVELNRRGRVTHLSGRARDMLAAPGEAAPGKGLSFAPVGTLSPLSSIVNAALADAVGSPPREAAVTLGQGKMVMAKARRMRFGVLLTLEDMTADEYVDRMTSWGSMAQRMAHGIKNPLTAISLALQQLEQHCSPEGAGLAASMKSDIERLGKMADGFMRFTKLEPPKLEPTDLNELLRSCVGRFENAKPAGVSIRYELAQALPLLPLDKEQLASACSNIIENAIGAVGDSGTLTVSTSLAGKSVEVRIRDTGKGIPARYLSKVFEPYFTLKRGGTGLGLCIAKKIVEDHKGAISVESKQGVGTTVTITLPAFAGEA